MRRPFLVNERKILAGPRAMAMPSYQQPDLDRNLDHAAGELRERGYVVLERVLPDRLLTDLLRHFQSLDDEKFRRAGIGRVEDFQVNRFVRTDEIHWLEGTHPATREYFDLVERIRTGLNRRLFLGLFDYECHYAYYPEGAFYKKHLDAFRGQNTRVLSTVLYLNPHWLPGDGGELLLYHPVKEGLLETVEPRFGTLAIFLSEEVPHEVLPANAPRYSLTGWFRKNNSLGESIDPVR